ncbi:MAG: 2-C-methyl-D-erythritol 2,4-cyclodiphosphate synthase [Clostridia bacterium]|nr:2-C-methyl-D-erythritol 2,4-cyclodiphosphate synthase [Clostridia bacterium]
MRIGIGYDVHKLCKNRKLILGGVDIPFEMGLLGHSDADVLLHAISDALLGAAALGDIGKHFPDTDQSYKDIDSMILLERVNGILKEKGYNISNIDATVVCQKPKLAPFIEQMRINISACLKIDISQVNIKATTTETLGFEGRKEGISSHAVCLIEKRG